MQVSFSCLPNVFLILFMLLVWIALVVQRHPNETVGLSETARVIPVVVHRIVYREDLRHAAATDEMILTQIQVLNDAFAPHFEFSLVNVTDTINPDYYRVFHDDNETLYAMGLELRQGGAETLNIYTGRPHAFGFSSFPFDVETNITLDGIVVLDQTLPGGKRAPYNLGMTIVHEVAHWLGLFHVFQGGCTPPGDFVNDTLPQAGPTSPFNHTPPPDQLPTECPPFRATCLQNETGRVGLQPNIKDYWKATGYNYMDYVRDECMTHFTPGQIDRMLTHWQRFREPRPPRVTETSE